MPNNHLLHQTFPFVAAVLLSCSVFFSCGHKTAKQDKGTLSPQTVEGSHKMLKAPYLQLLVAFEALPSKEERLKLWEKHRVKEIEQVGKNALILVEAAPTTTQQELDDLRTALAAEKGVRYAEPNVQMRIFK